MVSLVVAPRDHARGRRKAQKQRVFALCARDRVFVFSARSGPTLLPHSFA
jgi:hypothetical protein